MRSVQALTGLGLPSVGFLKLTGRGKSPWRRQEASVDALCLTMLKYSSIPWGVAPVTAPSTKLHPNAPGSENSAQAKLEGEGCKGDGSLPAPAGSFLFGLDSYTPR